MKFEMSSIDFSEVENSEYSLIPAGNYNVTGINAEALLSKKHQHMWKVEFRILDGEFQDRRIFMYFSVENDSQKTVLIALAKIKEWMLSVGFTGNEDLDFDFIVDNLLGKEFVAKVGVKPSTNPEYGPSNIIKKFSKSAMTELSEPVSQAAPKNKGLKQNPWA